MSDKVYMVPNPIMPGITVRFDPEKCSGCNKCVEICRTDVLMPNPEEGGPPIVVYPDECWFEGDCVGVCPIPEAITLVHPLNRTVVMHWKRKETGETFRIGMKNPPPPNTRPALGPPVA
jgi:NAD-dependent dihydropyrimidine dehydrogenase PreA subunit